MLLMACVCLLVAGLGDKEGEEEFSKSLPLPALHCTVDVRDGSAQFVL